MFPCSKLVLVLAAFLVVPGLTLHSAESHGREWTDSTGQFHRSAEFVRRDGNEVWLVGTKDNSIRVAWDRLSLGDQQYIDGTLAKLSPPSADAGAGNPGRTQVAGLFRLANLQSKSTDFDPNDHRNYDQEGSERRVRKYIYSCCYNSFHLVAQWGTADYHYHGHWLALLLRDFGKEAVDPAHFYYRPFFGDPHTHGWAYQRWSSDPCGRYAVFRSDGKHWRFFCFAHRSRPN